MHTGVKFPGLAGYSFPGKISSFYVNHVCERNERVRKYPLTRFHPHLEVALLEEFDAKSQKTILGIFTKTSRSNLSPFENSEHH